MTKSLDVQAAEWLIVGFNKCWGMIMLYRRLEEIADLDTFGFIPKDDQRGLWGKISVRAFVARNWPKLNNFLTDNPPVKQLSAAPQIAKLNFKPTKEWVGLSGINAKETKELTKSQAKYKNSVREYNIARSAFQRGRATEWNNCK